ncbi:MAG: ROK family protein [Pseudomonadota bacterium]
MAKAETLIVADIGGTNTRVALVEGGTLSTDTIRKFPNAEYPGLERVLADFVDHVGGGPIAGACVAVAGPVRDGTATLTNLDWGIDSGTVKRPTGAARVAVLNDLQAQGHAIGRIAPDNLKEILTASSGPRQGPSLVIGVGTGFNCAPVHDYPGGRLVTAAEAGHVNLPIRNQSDLSLAEFVGTVHGFPAIEDVLSGRGLERIYAWLGHRDGTPAEARAADIMAACADRSDPRAGEAAETFIRILGTVAGNLALIHLPFGGIYMAGGVARAFLPYYRDMAFGDAFRDKGRFAGFMGNFSVSLIDDDFAALLGCAAHLSRLA